MALRDDTMEGCVSSFILDSVEPKQSGEVLSPEDVAWADSCLVKDSEISDSSWDSLKDALLEIRTSQADSLDFSATGREGFPGGTGIEILPSSEEAQTSPNLRKTDDDAVPSNEEVEQDSDDYIILKKIDKLKSRAKLRNPFLPNYSEDLKASGNTGSGLDVGFPVFAMEPSSEDIFTVWDLDVPAEDDELIKQLNKALAETSLQPLPLIPDESGAWKELKKEPLDDLIAAISDLSLNQISG